MEAKMTDPSDERDIIDRHELQRLLDGRLAADERELLLELADEEPQSWRVIALAFIEEQVLREELSQFSSEEFDGAVRASKEIAVVEQKRSSWSSLLVQVAVVLLLVGAGTLIGRYSVPKSDDLGGYTIVVAPDQQLDQQLDQQRTGWNVQTTGNDQNPAVAAASLRMALDLMPRPFFDQESRSVIHNHGYTVMEEPVLYMIQTQAGEHYVIPHRNVSLVAHKE
ncbi:MAG: hypothetical protein ACI9HK_001372 [Pirellulaceae bacterium]|jgi:hypothetical protein